MDRAQAAEAALIRGGVKAALGATLGALALAGCGSGGDQPARGEAAEGAPNIVAIVTDDQTLEQFDRQTMPRTTRLLAERGTSFTDFIVTTPLCCPSRATFITGQYAHNNGVTSNTYKKLEHKENVLPAWLQRAGYRTAHVGKYLNNFTKALDDPAEVTPGWDDWFTPLEPRYYDYEVSDDGEVLSFGDDPDDYLTRVLNRKAVELVERYAETDEPFYLQLDQFAPHFNPGGSDDECDGGAVPDPDDVGLVGEATLAPRPSRDDPDVSDKPAYVRALDPLDRAERRQIERHYGCAVASLRAVDRGVGQLVRALDEAGELERTAFIFTSDNGYFYGEHRIPAKKELPYEEDVHMPLVIRLPADLAADDPVTRVDVPTANIDLAPTILDLAGADPCRAAGECRRMDGRSLVPLLRSPDASWPEDRAVLIELSISPDRARGFPRPCEYAAVRAEGQVYIRHTETAKPGGLCEPSDEVEHYDLERDLFQLSNLAASEPRGSLRRRQAELERRLEELRECEGSAAADDPGERPCE